MTYVSRRLHTSGEMEKRPPIKFVPAGWITTAEAAKMLGVSTGQVARMCRNYDLACLFNSKLHRWFISPSSVERLILDRRGDA